VHGIVFSGTSGALQLIISTLITWLLLFTIYIYIKGGCTGILKYYNSETMAKGLWLWTWYLQSAVISGILGCCTCFQHMNQTITSLHMIYIYTYRGDMLTYTQATVSLVIAGLLALGVASTVITGSLCAAAVSQHMSYMTTSLHMIYIYMHRLGMHTNIHVIALRSHCLPCYFQWFLGSLWCSPCVCKQFHDSSETC